MTLTQLRKVTKPGQRRGQARYMIKGHDGKPVPQVINDRLSGLVAYTVIPRLRRGQDVEVRWTLLRPQQPWQIVNGVRRPGAVVTMTPWVRVTSENMLDNFNAAR